MIVDASVALKWVLDEEDSHVARSVVPGALAAPEFLLTECAAVLGAKVRRGVISPESAREGWTVIADAPLRWAPSTRSLAEGALHLAIATGRTAYDCTYLSLALIERTVLLTADVKFARAIRSVPAYASSVRLLGE